MVIDADLVILGSFTVSANEVLLIIGQQTSKMGDIIEQGLQSDAQHGISMAWVCFAYLRR